MIRLPNTLNTDACLAILLCSTVSFLMGLAVGILAVALILAGSILAAFTGAV